MKESSQDYLALLGYFYLRHGRVAEARTALEGLSVLAPGNAWVRPVLAYTHLQEGDWRECLEQLDRSPRSQRSTTEQVLRIRALWGLDRRDEARRLLAELQGRLRDRDD